MTCSFRRVRYLEIFLAHAWEKEEKDNNFSFVGKTFGDLPMGGVKTFFDIFLTKDNILTL